MNPDINYYNILKIPSSASFEDVKKAYYQRARENHSDKGGNDEIMKVVNQAYEVLKNQQIRQDYDDKRDTDDDVYGSADISGFLHVGKKWSDEFIAKINTWKNEGAGKDTACFKNPNLRLKDQHPSPSESIPSKEFKNFLNSKVPSTEESFAKILPQEIFQWTFSKIPYSFSQAVWDSNGWNVELPKKPKKKSKESSESPQGDNNELLREFESFQQDDQECFRHAETILDAPATTVVLNCGNLKQQIFNPLNSSTTSSVSFLSANHHFQGAQVPVCQYSPQIKSALGVIPMHTVVSSQAIMPTEALECTGCEQPFGFFRWKYQCASCGDTYCDDCLKLEKNLDFVEPVRLCPCCTLKNHDSLKVDWCAPVENKKSRVSLGSQFLPFIHEMGYADTDTFNRWAEYFFKEALYDKTLQCVYYGKGDALDWVIKLANQGKYSFAKTCLKWVSKKEKKHLIQIGDDLAKTNPKAALLCYQEANLNEQEYIGRAFLFSDSCIARYCLAAAKELSKKDSHTFFLSIYSEVMSLEKYELLLLCALQGKFTQNQWIKMINAVKDIRTAEQLIHTCADSCCIDWKSVMLKSDREHLKWPFLSYPKFEKWFGYLEDLLKRDSGKYCIPFFRLHMSGENFVVHRDKFLESKQYSKMLLCHCLSPNRLSWEDLAKKLQTKDETASLAAYLRISQPIHEIGDILLKEGKTSLALRCYFQNDNIQEIEKLAIQGDSQRELLFLWALWKRNRSNPKYFLELIQMLKKNPAHAKPIQDILIQHLKTLKEGEKITFYKLLYETELSDSQRLGLLERLSNAKLNVTDKDWFLKVLSAYQSKFQTSLTTIIRTGSLAEALSFAEQFHSIHLSAIEASLKEVSLDTQERNPGKSVGLVIRALSRLITPSGNQLLEAMHDLTEAILCDPTDESMKHYCVVMEKISNLTGDPWKLRGPRMSRIEESEHSEFKDRLKRTPGLKMLLKYEAGVKDLKPFDRAISYIDLCMAVDNTPGFVGSLLNAALELQRVLLDATSPKEKYAYKKAIVELVVTAYTIGDKLCPATHLYTIRAGIAILTASFRKMDKIHENDQKILEELYNEGDRLSQIAPALMGRLVQTFDLVYLDCIYRELMSQYLDKRRKNEKDPKYQYYLLAGSHLGWLDPEKFNFEEERVNTMQAILQDKKKTMDHVETLMSWPAIKRDENGWLLNKVTPLQLTGQQKYARVNGIRFNMDTGAIDFLLEEPKNPRTALFDENDITFVMQNGITGAFFSLDPIDPKMDYHPFQKMTYAPDCLQGSDYLATMLHADMLMKWLSMGTEVSGMAPFNLREAEEGLLKRLPEGLRKKFVNLTNTPSSTAGKIHRFWIQAPEELYFDQIQEGNILTVKVGDGKMSVRKNLMIKDEKGNLIDVENDHENDSREAKFATLMTKHYDSLGQYFPEFARLKQLLKLQTLSYFAQCVYQNRIEQIQQLNIPQENIESDLNNFKSEFDQGLKNFIGETVRKYNGQLSCSQLTEIKRTIRDNSTKKFIKTCAPLIAQNYHATHINIDDQVTQWLNYNNSSDLVEIFKNSLETHLKNEVGRICQTFKKYRIATELGASLKKNSCEWVPAAFKRKEVDDKIFRVYGGVNMQSRPTPMPGGAYERSMGGGSSLPPKGGHAMGGPNVRPYYVEGMGPHGRLYGTNVGVDRVTGNTYRVLDVGSCIRDRYNAGSSYPNTNAYWGTYVGYTNVHHYSRHTVGSTHFHYTNGWTQCTNAQGNTTSYQSGSKSHRC